MTKFKLPKKIKDKWVKALRSGKYKQGTGYRKSLDSKGTPIYCCLGVAEELGLATPRGVCFLEDTFLPMDIQHKLAAWNDGIEGWDLNAEELKKSFKAIATWIEKNL